MPDYREVYRSHAARYDRLVAREDHEGNLARALEALLPAGPFDLVETGAGTGRVTRMLSPRARSVRAFDAAPAMVDVARERLAPFAHVAVDVAPHDALPVADACADVACEGWAFGHAVGWNPEGWRDELARNLRELTRVVRPGGLVVLVETMGTGVARPFEGGHSLEPFHAALVDAHGFAHRCVRTDYRFDDVDQAVAELGFFFGERMASRASQWTDGVVPECTGLYWRRNDA